MRIILPVKRIFSNIGLNEYANNLQLILEAGRFTTSLTSIQEKVTKKRGMKNSLLMPTI